MVERLKTITNTLHYASPENIVRVHFCTIRQEEIRCERNVNLKQKCSMKKSSIPPVPTNPQFPTPKERFGLGLSLKITATKLLFLRTMVQFSLCFLGNCVKIIFWDYVANLLLYRLSTVLEQILLLDILIKATLSKKREHFYLFQQKQAPTGHGSD